MKDEQLVALVKQNYHLIAHCNDDAAAYLKNLYEGSPSLVNTALQCYVCLKLFMSISINQRNLSGSDFDKFMSGLYDELTINPIVISDNVVVAVDEAFEEAKEYAMAFTGIAGEDFSNLGHRFFSNIDILFEMKNLSQEEEENFVTNVFKGMVIATGKAAKGSVGCLGVIAAVSLVPLLLYFVII